MRRARRGAVLGLRIGAVGAVGALLAWRVDWDAMGRLTETGAWPLLAAAAAVGLLAVPLKLVAWRATVAQVMPEAGNRVSVRALAGPLVIGAALNTLVPARAGELARVALARRSLARGGRPPSALALAGSIGSESLYSAMTWALLVAVVAAMAPVPGAAAMIGVGLAALWLALLIVALWAPARPPQREGERHGRAGLLRSMKDAWWSLLAGQRLIRQPGSLLAVLAASLGAWIVQILSVMLVLAAFGMDHAVGLAGAALVVVVLSVAQFVPVLPGNIGVFQGAVALPLVTTYGIGADEAIVVATVLQAVQVLPLLALGVIAAFREGVLGAGLGAWATERPRPATAAAVRSDA
jgi:uncharacterized membrane protein YbhN (UPF0104 family)